MIVVDASAIVELLLDTAEGADVADRLEGHRLHAPMHLDLEVYGAIRRAVARELISDRDGLLAVAESRSLRVRRWPINGLLQRAYELRATHTVADGLYIALAESTGWPLLTCDGHLAKSHGHTATLQLP